MQGGTITLLLFANEGTEACPNHTANTFWMKAACSDYLTFGDIGPSSS